MCGRFSQFSEVETIAEAFGAEPDGVVARRIYNLAPTADALVVLEDDGTRRLDRFRWGLVPFWAKDPSVGGRLINARMETVSEKPSFRNAFAQRRCLVPANGYFEWTGAKGKRQPWYIHASGGGLLAFAGLWERWQPKLPDTAITSFAILTAPAIGRIDHIHHRMPLMVPPGDVDAWLRPDHAAAESLLESLKSRAADVDLRAHRVSPAMNAAVYNRSDCIAPVELPV